MPDLRSGSIGQIFSTITDHIRLHGRQGRSIVSVSWGATEPSDLSRRSIVAMKEDIQELERESTFILFAAGNAALKVDRHGQKRARIDTAPAMLSDGRSRSIVVSNTDRSGFLYATSQSFDNLMPGVRAPNNLFAPGVDVQCAAHDSNRGFSVRTGTSFCKSLAYLTFRSTACGADLDNFL